MTGVPIFTGPDTTGSNEEQQIYFKCQVQYVRQSNDTYARFLITFVFDGFELENIGAPHKRLPPFILGPSDDISAKLTEYHLQGRLGKEVRYFYTLSGLLAHVLLQNTLRLFKNSINDNLTWSYMCMYLRYQ